MPNFKIGERTVGDEHAAYFIADVAANHDGSLERARKLIQLAAKAGADAAKFQHFRAEKIVSDFGFRSLGTQQSHQAKWHESVFEIYRQASLPWEWTPELKATCDQAGIEFLSTPYDFEAANMLDPYVQAFKIGSGDITWIEMLEHVACKKKPVILSTGASSIADVRRAADALTAIDPRFALLQCNTNYTGEADNLKHIHLNVLRSYRELFPSAVLGLSDHTAGHSTVLGAVALGANIIEKHFTDDCERQGPDHAFSMTPVEWREMVARTRELEQALGSADKCVNDNEKETVVLQRRCLRAARDLPAGKRLERSDIEILRPAPHHAIPPHEIDRVMGRRLAGSMARGQEFRWVNLQQEAFDAEAIDVIARFTPHQEPKTFGS
jgi:sialic acid synthase SpsE